MGHHDRLNAVKRWPRVEKLDCEIQSNPRRNPFVDVGVRLALLRTHVVRSRHWRVQRLKNLRYPKYAYSRMAITEPASPPEATAVSIGVQSKVGKRAKVY